MSRPGSSAFLAGQGQYHNLRRALVVRDEVPQKGFYGKALAALRCTPATITAAPPALADDSRYRPLPYV